ncbi:MAG: hypothetical protein PHH08_00235 [Candidatus ainarchaeum sp.]|nr:hypothetical protein [Candidatus ainarchaeum sp.]
MRRIVRGIKNVVVSRKNPKALARFKRMQEFKRAQGEERVARKAWERAEKAYDTAVAAGAPKRRIEALLSRRVTAHTALERAFKKLKKFKK